MRRFNIKKVFFIFLLAFTLFSLYAKPKANDKITEVDYSKYFEDCTGCAVFLKDGEFFVYEKEKAYEEISPCSTFKIPATLIGLESGVLTSTETKMGYDGKTYPFESWQKDLTLKEAFQYSCVWYFRKVIDKTGKKDMAKGLKALNYGNQNISEWNGSGLNGDDSIDGFWLESSLKISCINQAKVVSDIFEGRTKFKEENIAILKSIMKTGEKTGATIYGKTGTGRSNSGWFVGMYEEKGTQIYFAVRVDGKQNSPTPVVGKDAKEIAERIIESQINGAF